MPRPTLACPGCGSEAGIDREWALRECENCGIEFRPRRRVPRYRAAGNAQQNSEIGGMLVVGLFCGLLIAALRICVDPSPPTPSYPPTVFEPVVIPPIDIQVPDHLFDPSEIDLHHERHPVVSVHQLIRDEGRVQARGELLATGEAIADPGVRVIFLDASGEELGRAMALVSCPLLDGNPCAWVFESAEPPETADLHFAGTGTKHFAGLVPSVFILAEFDEDLRPLWLVASDPRFGQVEFSLRRVRARAKSSADVVEIAWSGVPITLTNLDMRLAAYDDRTVVGVSVIDFDAPARMPEQTVTRWVLALEAQLLELPQ